MTSQLADLDKLADVMRDSRERAIAAAGQALEAGAKLIQQKAQERLTQGAADADVQRLAGSITVEREGLQAVIGTKDAEAKAREFGTMDAAPRAFLGPAALECRDNIHALIGKAVSGALKGEDSGGA